MTTRALLRESLIVLGENITIWKWQNRDYYPPTKHFETVGNYLGFPLDIFGERLAKERGFTQAPFIKEWCSADEIFEP